MKIGRLAIIRILPPCKSDSGRKKGQYVNCHDDDNAFE